MGQEAALEQLRNVAVAGAVFAASASHLSEQTRLSVEATLVECAELARSNVLLLNQKHFKGPSPTPEECNRMVKDKTGKTVKLSILLGTEMHDDALNCVEGRLDDELPGRFSREPRYRYDSRTRQVKVVSPEEVQALKDTGNIGELKGSIAPDVVIHTGNPLQAQAIYDFKFRCPNTDEIPDWTTYPEDHPYHGRTQEYVYQQFLGPKPARVVPRQGIIR